MSYKIAIASGKGGTGKTTVAANLYHFFRLKGNVKVQLVDCDVEEPNDHIFFPMAKKDREETIHQMIPVIDTTACTFCRRCAEYCEFNAIVVIPHVSFAEINPHLCHSCGACLAACQDHAITETQQAIGKLSFYHTSGEGSLIQGKLAIGSAMQTMLIRELKKAVPGQAHLTIYDAPPGTSCPVVETISDAHFVILVAEPTRFGLHDLTLMVELMAEVQQPFGVIINKAGLGSNEIYSFLQNQGIELLGEIPYMETYAKSYARGNLFQDIPEEIKISYDQVMVALESKLLTHEGNHYFKR